MFYYIPFFELNSQHTPRHRRSFFSPKHGKCAFDGAVRVSESFSMLFSSSPTPSLDSFHADNEALTKQGTHTTEHDVHLVNCASKKKHRKKLILVR